MPHENNSPENDLQHGSSKRMRGLFENTYNIITIEKGKIKVDLKIVGGKSMPLKGLVENYKRFGEE